MVKLLEPHELYLEHGNKLLPILLPIYRNLSNPGIQPPNSYGQLLTVLIPKIDKPANKLIIGQSL
jgi:hypothetical protein